MRTLWIVTAAAFAFACKGKDEPKPAVGGSATGSGELGSASTGAAAGSATSGAAPSGAADKPGSDPRCATPCLFLDKSSLAEVGSAFEKTCGAAWPVTSDSDCEQLDYQRNCIYAANGYTFKKKKWTNAFGKLAWYKPRAEFKDQDLSAIATANIAELKQRSNACRRGTTLAPADNKLARAWLAKLAKGHPDIPALVFDYSMDPPEKLDAAEMRKHLIQRKGVFGGRKAHMSSSTAEAATVAALPGKALHAISIDDSGECAFDPNAGDEECGGFTVTLVFDDKGVLQAVEQQLSACPMVYSMTSTPVFEGEILRNLDRPSLEQTRALRITTPQCAGIARYRIAEQKPEITSLDSIALVVDGVELAPEECAAANAAFCTNDGNALQLARGQYLDVTFAIPAGSRCQTVELRANGHYVKN